MFPGSEVEHEFPALCEVSRKITNVVTLANDIRRLLPAEKDTAPQGACCFAYWQNIMTFE